MATARLEKIQFVQLPWALFSYFVGTWMPIMVSVALFGLWNGVGSFFGWTPLPILKLTIFLVLLRQLNVFTLSTLFHRSYSHRQFEYHPLVEHPMRVWNWLFMGTGGKSWSILHRWHHADSDTDNDPHSPTKTGGSLRNITKQTFQSYQLCLNNPDDFKQYETKNLPDDGFERWVRWLESKKLPGLVLFRLPILIALMVFVVPFMTVPAAVLSMPGVMGSVWYSTVIMVNGLCHVIGYRVWDNDETSTNLFPIDLFGWGEALHHNHHEKQSRANLAHNKWEFDPGFWALWMLSKVGIVRKLRP